MYTSHIHADDLAAALVRSLEDDAPAGIYNACDDSELRMGDWMDLVAERCGLARPPRLARAQMPEPSSFMMESRRLDNRKLKQVLGLRLLYPSVHEGLRHAEAAGVH